MPLDRNTLLATVESLFTSSRSANLMGVGAELELIPFGAERGEPVPVTSLSGVQSLPVLRGVGRYARWVETASNGDPPSWSTPTVGEFPSSQAARSSSAVR